MNSKSLGTRAYVVDFHVHTTASGDFRELRKTAADVIAAAAQAGIDVLAVSDHNTGSGIADARAAARGTPITVLPGVEITIPAGHILGLFEKDTAEAFISDLLIKISSFPPQRWGVHQTGSSPGLRIAMD